LGNYVDFGFNSLEIICLLFALKIKYKDSICLLRGGHEDIKINRIYGLAEECAIRLQENVNDEDSVFCLINQVFDYLPLAGLIDN
jgi:protein phosphatase